MNTHLQMRANMSPLPVAKRLFVGLGATEITVEKGRQVRTELDRYKG